MIPKLWRKRLYRPEALELLLSDCLDLRGPVLENRVHLEEAAQWILRAQKATSDDGVSGGYSFEDGWIASYPETTGYIIPTLLGYASYCENPRYRQQALAMAEWELTVQLKSGAFPGHFVDHANPPVVFNTGQVIFGLVAAYQETGDERFLNSASRAGAWLVEVQDEDGAWYQFDYQGIEHSYNTRTAWALIELARVTEDRSFLKAGQRNLDWALSQQEENGWFRKAAFTRNGDPFLHTIAYAAQGLLEAGLSLDRTDYVKVGERTCRAVLPLVDSKGLIAGTFDRRWQPSAGYSCLTGNAQISVLWLRLYSLTGDRIFRESAQRVNQSLKSLQNCRKKNAHIRGAIKGSHPIWGRYLFGTYPNWATKFFMDALLLEEAILLETEPWIRCW